MRKLYINEINGDYLTIQVSDCWLKSHIFRFILKEYGQCLSHTQDDWRFSRATVQVEGTEPVLAWKLRR